MKILFLFCFVFVLIGCSDLVFIYDTNQSESILISKTSTNITGDDKNIIGSALNKKIKKSQKATYILDVASRKKETNIVTESNKVASKINIQYTIAYKVRLMPRNCIIFKDRVVNEASYNSKSAGYNFGTDLSKSKLIEGLIDENIEIFLKRIRNNVFYNTAKTEPVCDAG
jgi:hypothetical protein